MSDLHAPPSKRARLTQVARADVPSKLLDVILSKCDAREQLLITGLSKSLREKPVRALILSALEMSRTWPPMTSRDLQWTLIVRHADLEPVDVKWRLEDRRAGDIVAIRAENCTDLGEPPYCKTLEEFWTRNVTVWKKGIDLDKLDEQFSTAPFVSDLEHDYTAPFDSHWEALLTGLDGLDDGPFQFEPCLEDLFADEQLDDPAVDLNALSQHAEIVGSLI